MGKKSLFVLVLIMVFAFVFLTPQAQAGSADRYRLEGIALGVGAAIIGGAILHSISQTHHDVTIVYHEPARVRSGPAFRGHQRSGHWELQKEWVPSTYKRTWNPGHYDRHGHWVQGRWIKVVDQAGYWVSKRIWVK